MKIKILILTILVLPLINSAQEDTTRDEEIKIERMYVEEQAEYPGGLKALYEYLRKNIKIPKIIRVRGEVSGKVFVKFMVNEEGKVEEVSILKGLTGCEECDEETLKAIKKMPRWKAAKMQGKNVKCYFNLPVSFK